MHWTVYLEGGPRRVNHAAAAVGNLIYSFGGYCSSNVHLFSSANEPIDIHVFNTSSLTWKTLDTPKKHTQQRKLCPFQRYGHTVVSHGSLIYLWGGRNDNNLCNQLFCFDTETHLWSCPLTYGTIPPARDGHSACIIDSIMYVFGGFEDEFERYSQDVYALDLRTYHWSYLTIQGEYPEYRDFHSGTALGNNMYIFGGRSDIHGPHSFEGEMYPTHLVYLDIQNMKWVRPSVVGMPPVGRRSHSAFVYEDKLYIFGGFNGLLNKHYNDLHEYCPVRREWRQIKTTGNAPSPRRRQAAIIVHSLLFLFGGTSPDPLCNKSLALSGEMHLKDHDDLFILDLSPSLKTLSLLAVKNYNIDTSNIPIELKQEIHMTSRTLIPDSPASPTDSGSEAETIQVASDLDSSDEANEWEEIRAYFH